MGRAFLLTGEPRVGKTTALKKVIEGIGVERCGGFYTEEQCAMGQRYAFQLVTLDGQRGVLADVAYNYPLKIGKYGVTLQALESIGLDSIYEALASKQFIIIDEIGPMQLLSPQFMMAVMSALESRVPILGTLFSGSNHWSDELKRHERVSLYPLTLDNREMVPQTLIKNLIEE